MIRKLYTLILFVLILNSSCQFVFDRVMNKRPGNDKFKYYTERQNNINVNLHTEEFYMLKDTSGVLTYLAFKPDNTVIYFGSTAMVSDTLYKYKSIYNPKRKRNRRPKDLLNDFGYYITKKDSIFISINKMGVFGSDKMYEFKGKIYSDSLVLNWKKTEQEFSPEYNFERTVFIPYKPE